MITLEELIEQLEGQHNFEHGMIDPTDWERFTCWDLLQVIAGRLTIQDLVWGTSASEKVGETPEGQAAIERDRLTAWNNMVGKK